MKPVPFLEEPSSEPSARLSPGAGERALTESLEEDDSDGDRDVERSDVPFQRNREETIARLFH
jgi:hypothetical protein